MKAFDEWWTHFYDAMLNTEKDDVLFWAMDIESAESIKSEAFPDDAAG